LGVVVFTLLVTAHRVCLGADRYRPPGIVPSNATLAAVRALYERTAPDPQTYGRRIERSRTVAKGTPFASTTTIRDGDYRIATTLEGATYETGRSDGRRWRRTPAGAVRIVASDVQGDDLDRWPVATLGFSFDDCTVLGETRAPDPAYVLEDRAPGDVPHWLYVDAATGEIRREVTRDGSRVVSFAFNDFRPATGPRRAYAWHVDGAGGPADVTVDDVSTAPIEASAVALPPNVATFHLQDERTSRLPTSFGRRNRIFVDVLVDGKKTQFILDTGTTQMLIDGGAAYRLGLHESLDHATVHRFVVGPIESDDVPFLTVGNVAGAGDGILGFEFFSGYVVHVDYERGFVEIIPHRTFVPPPGAHSISISYAEGIPLAAGRIGAIAGNRFALDTGSIDLVLPSYLADTDGRGVPIPGSSGAESTIRYLEGPITIRKHVVPFQLGSIDFGSSDAFVERRTPESIDIPLDAIVGTRFLQALDLYFDYDDGTLYAKPV